MRTYRKLITEDGLEIKNLPMSKVKDGYEFDVERVFLIRDYMNLHKMKVIDMKHYSQKIPYNYSE